MKRNRYNIVFRIEGERWRFHVPSDDPNEPPYLVDLSAWLANGECACPHFQIRLLPIVRCGISEHPLRCKHIIRARGFILDEILLREINQDKQT